LLLLSAWSAMPITSPASHRASPIGQYRYQYRDVHV